MSFLLSVVSENAKHSFSAFFDVFKTAFVSFSWTDAVDILILACILFFAFRFFKKTQKLFCFHQFRIKCCRKQIVFTHVIVMPVSCI